MRALLLTAAVAMMASHTNADLVMEVKPSSAPNVFGSPSWATYLSRGLNSLENGTGNDGSRLTDPAAYEILGSVVDPGDFVVSGFNSWRGVADPASPFDGEFGNRLHFGLHIVGDTQFRLDNLTFNLNSTDSGNGLAFTGDFVGFNYSAARVGIDYFDGIKGNGNDITYTSGSGTNLVNELIYIGVGNAFDATFEPGANNQDKMDNVLSYILGEAPFDISTTYTLLDDDENVLAVDSASVTVGAVPELNSFALLGFVSVGTAVVAYIRRYWSS